MKKRKLILIIISLLLIIIPFTINIYSIYKLIIVFLGIIILDITVAYNKKINIFLLIYFPIILLIFTYAIDYIKLYSLNISPVYVIQNKINDKVSIYNSLFYRVYKCGNEFKFDNEYEENFMCDTSLIDNIEVNNLLSDPIENYKKYKNDFIKITGKISKINGTNSIELEEYIESNDNLNGHVKFKDDSKIIVNLKNIKVLNYKVYDYITIVGLLKDFDKSKNEMIFVDSVIEENNLYDNFDIEVIESNNCDKTLKEYTDNYYTYCIDNIYLDYKVDTYELSYAIKDGKININDLIKDVEPQKNEDKEIYELEKFDILRCKEDKNILITKNNLDYSLCEE